MSTVIQDSPLTDLIAEISIPAGVHMSDAEARATLLVFLRSFPPSLTLDAVRYLNMALSHEDNLRFLLDHALIITKKAAFPGLARFIHHCAARTVCGSSEGMAAAFTDFERRLSEDGYHKIRGFLSKAADSDKVWKETRVYSLGNDVVSKSEFHQMLTDVEEGTPSHRVAVFYTVYNLAALQMPDDNAMRLLLQGANGAALSDAQVYEVYASAYLPFEAKANFLTRENGTINHFAALTTSLKESEDIMKRKGALSNKKQIGETMNQLSNLCHGNYFEVVALHEISQEKLKVLKLKDHGHYLISEAAKSSEQVVVLTRFVYKNAQVLFRSTEKAVLERVIALNKTLGKSSFPEHLRQSIKKFHTDYPDVKITGAEGVL